MFALLLRLKRGIKRSLKVRVESGQFVSLGFRPRIWRVLLVLVFATLVMLAAPGLEPGAPINLPRAGDIAPGTIIAPIDLTIRKSAAELQADAARIAAELPPILDFDTLVLLSLRARCAALRKQLAMAGDPRVSTDSLQQEITAATGLPPQLSTAILRAAPRLLPVFLPFSSILEDLHQSPGLLANGIGLPPSGSRTVIIRRGLNESVVARDRIKTTDGARAILLDQLKAEHRFDPTIQGLLAQVGGQLLRPTLTINAHEQQLRIKEEVDRLDSIDERIPAGTVLVRSGEVMTARQAYVLGRYLARPEDDHKQTWWQSVVVNWSTRFLLVALTAVGLIAFLRRFRREIYRSLPKLTAIFLFLGVAVGGALIASDIAALFGVPSLPLLPVSLLSFLLAMLVDTEVALLATVCLAIVLGLIERFSFAVTLHTVIVGTMTAFLAAEIRRRSDAFRVVLLTAVITTGSLVLIRLVTGGEVADLRQVIGLGMLAGVIYALVAIFLIVPGAESLFGFTTDIRLLELTDLNHPLLRRLALEAPGTYHHSLQVSSLSEAAAKGIGGNVLLTRAGALFHDIGKVEIPEYFVENQHGLKSRHEQLTPTMSALILASHVKRGRKLGEDADLPDDVLNFIEEHHGTLVMTYFYRKALDQASASERAELSENSFRYPGPRPRSRDKAIVMLADAVEASSRTLDDPKPARLESLVQRVIADRFSSGELDACPLTLHDLSRIRRSFVQVLTAAFHQRVEYPKGVQPG